MDFQSRSDIKAMSRTVDEIVEKNNKAPVIVRPPQILCKLHKQCIIKAKRMEEKEMGRKRTPEEEATQLICVTMNKLWTHQNVP